MLRRIYWGLMRDRSSTPLLPSTIVVGNEFGTYCCIVIWTAEANDEGSSPLSISLSKNSPPSNYWISQSLTLITLSGIDCSILRLRSAASLALILYHFHNHGGHFSPGSLFFPEKIPQRVPGGNSCIARSIFRNLAFAFSYSL